MRHADYSTGMEFQSGDHRWRCSDIGQRTIVAFRLDHDDDPTWYSGPPYAVAETVFDEYDQAGCEALDAEIKRTNAA